jgi:hypothetical protein
MATKTVITRIKNKVDTLAAWQSYTGTLLNGEIVVVRVPTGTTYTNPVTGADEPVVELLMKVGDGETAFANLPWMSAKASDVYDWAKAATVEFNSTDNKIYFKNSAGGAIASVDLSAINSKITALETGKLSDITVSQSGSGVVKSVEKDGTGKIKITRSTVVTSDIAGSAVTTAKIADANVTTAKIADEAVTNAKLGTDISSDKINVGTGETDGTLSKKLSTMDAAIAANTAKLTGHTDTAINTLIDNKINDLDGGTDSGTAGAGKYVSKVTQTNGKVATTYTSFPTAATSTAGIVKLGATGGAATYDAVDALTKRVGDAEGKITNLQDAVAGGVHFKGTVTAKPTSSSVTVNGSTTITAAAGDVVIWAAEGIEYIYTGSKWEELGDIDRVGAIETAIAAMDVTGTNAVATTHKFVSQVTQTDGKIDVTYTQPTSADISHDDSTVSAKLSALDANKVDTNDSRLSDSRTPKAHNQASNTITAMTGYSKASSVTAISTSDSLNTAIGKLEKALDSKGTSNLTLAGSGSATTAAKSDHIHSGYEASIGAVEAKLNDVDSTVGASISTAISALTHTTSGSGSFVTDITQANGKVTITKGDLPTASTSAQGIVQLTNSTSSTSTTTAATPSSVKSAYDLASGANTKATNIQTNYVRFNSTDNKLYIGTDGSDEIIFDCGGAN